VKALDRLICKNDLTNSTLGSIFYVGNVLTPHPYPSQRKLNVFCNVNGCVAHREIVTPTAKNEPLIGGGEE
jgi:hypothetical protein